MSPESALRENYQPKPTGKPSAEGHKASGRPTIIIAAIDPDIRRGLTDLLEGYAVNKIWADGVKDVKNIISKQRIAACLCEFWLRDGTYREVIRHVRRERLEMPVIIVSSPACPQEFRDYLAAVNIGAIDFLSHPYRRADVERMLNLVTPEYVYSGVKLVSEDGTLDAATLELEVDRAA
jgi:DNA-binding NtrC family response regulator